MVTQVSYSQVREALEEEARELSSIAGQYPSEIIYSRNWIEACDGAEIFVEVAIVDFEMIFQLGPVLTPEGDLERNIRQYRHLDSAAKGLTEDINYAADVWF